MPTTGYTHEMFEGNQRCPWTFKVRVWGRWLEEFWRQSDKQDRQGYTEKPTQLWVAEVYCYPSTLTKTLHMENSSKWTQIIKESVPTSPNQFLLLTPLSLPPFFFTVILVSRVWIFHLSSRESKWMFPQAEMSVTRLGLIFQIPSNVLCEVLKQKTLVAQSLPPLSTPCQWGTSSMFAKWQRGGKQPCK